MIHRPRAVPTIVGYNVACPACDELVPNPDSAMASNYIWFDRTLREFPRAYCTACGLTFDVGSAKEEK